MNESSDIPTDRPTDRPTDHRQDNHNETGISDYSSFILHLAPPFFAALIAAPARDTLLWIEDRRERSTTFSSFLVSTRS